MDPVKAGWRISDLVAYDTAAADAISEIAALAAHAEADPVAEAVDGVRAKLRALADGATP